MRFGIAIALIILGIFGLSIYIKNFNEKINEVKYFVGKCKKGIFHRNIGKNFIYYEKNKTLVVFLLVNCCGINISIEKDDKEYRIYEKKVGEICRCMCEREVVIFNVDRGYRVIFINLMNKGKIISPSIGFCGISTYGKCYRDEDCIISGCSNQICQSKYEKPIITTCEYRECYNYKKYGLRCKCVNNRCQWT